MAQASVTNAGRKNALCSAVRWVDNYSHPSLACITPNAIKRSRKAWHAETAASAASREIQPGSCFFLCSPNNQVPKVVAIRISMFVSYCCIVFMCMFCVFNASNGKLKLSSTKIYTGLHMTRIGAKRALKCIKNVYIHIHVQYSKLTCNDSLANWKIISKLFLLNYPCLSHRFNTFYFPFI